MQEDISSLRIGDSMRRQLFDSDNFQIIKDNFQQKEILDLKDSMDNQGIGQSTLVFLNNNKEHTAKKCQPQNNSNNYHMPSFSNEEDIPSQLYDNKAKLQEDEKDINIKPQIINYGQSSQQILQSNLKISSGTENLFQNKQENLLKWTKMSYAWKHMPFHIIYYILKFLLHLKSISVEHRFKELSFNQFKIIGDSSIKFEYYKYHNFLLEKPNLLFSLYYFFSQKVKNKLFGSLIRTEIYKLLKGFIKENLIIIMPDSFFKLLWDQFILILLLINLIYIPLKLSFENQEIFQFNYMIKIFLDDLPGWAFLIDMLLNFNIAYYKKGSIITDRGKIVKHYFKSHLIWDAIVIIPFFINSSLNVPYLDIILLLRYNKMIKISNNYIEMLNLIDKQFAIYELIQLIMLILFIAHLCGCSLILVAYIEGIDNSWIPFFEISKDSWLDQYITAFYWATITMITVGYGEYHPINNTEKIVIIAIVLISCGVFAYSVNKIGTILQEMNETKQQYKKQMALIKQYLMKKGLSKDLQTKIKKYFEYIKDKREGDDTAVQEMFKQLPNSIKNEVKYDTYFKLLKQKKLFNLNFSDEFLKKLSLKIYEKKFGCEEIIYFQNEEPSRLFYLLNGEVELFINMQSTKNIITKNLKKGEIFGELNFFSEKIYDVSCRTSKLSTILIIERKDFTSLLKEFSSDQEQYCLLRDNYILYSSARNLGSKCNICNKYTHFQSKLCPYVNYIPNKDKILTKLNQKGTIYQDRGPFKRSDVRFENSLSNVAIVKQTMVQHLINNNQNEQIHNIMEIIDTIENAHKTLDNQAIPQFEYNSPLNNFNVPYKADDLMYDEIINESLKESDTDLQIEISSQKVSKSNFCQIQKSQTIQSSISQQNSRKSLEDQYPNEQLTDNVQQDQAKNSSLQDIRIVASNLDPIIPSQPATSQVSNIEQLQQTIIQRLIPKKRKTYIADSNFNKQLQALKTINEHRENVDEVANNNQKLVQVLDLLKPKKVIAANSNFNEDIYNNYQISFSSLNEIDKYHFCKKYYPLQNINIVIEKYNLNRIKHNSANNIEQKERVDMILNHFNKIYKSQIKINTEKKIQGTALQLKKVNEKRRQSIEPTQYLFQFQTNNKM